MWLAFDIAVIATIALSTFIGYKQGLVKAAIKILSFFIAIAVAFVLYKPVSGVIINNTPVVDNIKNAMIEKITPEGVDENQEVVIENNMALGLIGNATNTIDGIAEAFAIKLIETGTLLFIYIIVRIALKFITALADLIAKLPLLKQVNKLGGTVYGVLKGILLVYTILAIVYLITPLLSNSVKENIDKSIITKTLYNNNLILNILV